MATEPKKTIDQEPVSATAKALNVTLVGGGLVSSGQTTSSNDGSTETLTGTQFPALAVLGGQTVFSAGVLGQIARTFNDGTSAACAGLVGSGGTFTVGSTGTCTQTPGSELVLNLGVIGLSAISLRADVIAITCKRSIANSTASATLMNARIVSTVLGVDTTLLSLPLNPAPNTGLNIPGILNLTLNAQSSGGGELSASAVQLSALGGALASVSIGNVTC